MANTAMQNPISQRLGGNNRPNNVAQLVQMLKGGNPQAMFDQMMQSNPQFAQFVNNNKGKSVEQIARDYGVDIGMLQQLIR